MSTYVYGITRGSHPLPLAGLAGVGDQAQPLRVLRHGGDLAAVVSDAPANLRAKRRDLETHEGVLEGLCAAGTVLPMRFGLVAADDDAVIAELATGAPRYRELLARLDGKAELNVKAAHEEVGLLRDVLRQRRDLRDLNEALRRAGGGSHEQRVAFGERMARAVEQRRAEDAEVVLARLREHAEQLSLGPTVEGCFVNASFLVASGARDAFAGSVSRLEHDHAGRMHLRLYGPLPPYSFVDTGVAAA